MEKLIITILSIIILLILPTIGYHHLKKTPASPITSDAPPIEGQHSDTQDKEPSRDSIPTDIKSLLSFNQTNTKPKSFSVGKSKIICKANVEINAQILAITTHGNFKDVLSGKDTMPVDLGVVWGPHARNLPPDMTVRHGRPMSGFNGKNVWLYWEYTSKSRAIVKELENNIANIHIIPESAEIMDALKSVEKGSEVYLSGCLADLEVENKKYKTSMVRDDTGGGACEILFLTAFSAS